VVGRNSVTHHPCPLLSEEGSHFQSSQSVWASSSAMSLLLVLPSSWVFGLPFVGPSDVACGVPVSPRTPPVPSGRPAWVHRLRKKAPKLSF
jgi:hypothetical protein